MRGGRGRSNPLSMALLAMIALGCYGGYLFGPPHWDYMNMKELSRTAALEWKVSGQLSSAQLKLLSGMKKKHISTEIEDNDCKFREMRSTLTIICEWSIYVDIPFQKDPVERAYRIDTKVHSNGDVEQW